MDISCALPTTLDSPEHVRIAEQLGYRRAWLYDTPQQSPDIWMMLGLAAAQTERIELGPGVLIPTLRHPMTNAAGTAGLCALAPGRVVVGFGTGFTGRRAMGYGSISWAYVERYVDAYLALLRGETIEWEGATMRMLHPEGNAPRRPIEVPIVLSAFGPKGAAITRRRGHGIIVHEALLPVAGFDWSACIAGGTVLDVGESPHGERAKAAIGPGWALPYHLTYEYAGPDAVAAMPGGEAWLASIRRHPERERHLAVHDHHLIAMNEADHAAWQAGGSEAVEMFTITGPADQVRNRLDRIANTGVTEFIYQPYGPDIAGELERFHIAATS